MKRIRIFPAWCTIWLIALSAAACMHEPAEITTPDPQPDPALHFRVAGDHADHELKIYTSNSGYILYLHRDTDYTLSLEAEDPSGISRISWKLPTLYFEQHEFESAHRFVPMNGLLEKRRIYHDNHPVQHNRSIKASWKITTWHPNIIEDEHTPRNVVIAVENEDGSITEMQLSIELGAQREGFAGPR